ncbi:RING finger protein 215-like isoform X2 [Oscarella lobularis]|uniref:RING finger protein 215-like isoform X2 n=1 Tax=Oscarella lobularis TaxID=121494 RepID=UPI003313DFA5
MLFPIFLLVFDAALCAGDVTVQVNGFYSSRLEVVSLSGHFASIGASSNAEGDAVELPASCSSDKSTTPRLHPHGWIAVVDSTRSSEDNETKSCTFLSQARRAFLWGAAAVVFLAGDSRSKEFDAEQRVHRPVVILLQDQARKFREILDKKWNRLDVKIYLDTSSALTHSVSRVTLWTTCIRPVGRFAGTVCPGKETETYSLNFISASVLLTLFLSFLFLILRMRMAQHRSRVEEGVLEASLAKLAQGVVSRLPSKRYVVLRLKTRKRSSCPATGDSCSICLDEYTLKQVLRILPCGHSFHRSCVDSWLISRRTCPLCKYNILEAFSKTK